MISTLSGFQYSPRSTVPHLNAPVKSSNSSHPDSSGDRLEIKFTGSKHKKKHRSNSSRYTSSDASKSTKSSDSRRSRRSETEDFHLRPERTPLEADTFPPCTDPDCNNPDCNGRTGYDSEGRASVGSAATTIKPNIFSYSSSSNGSTYGDDPVGGWDSESLANTFSPSSIGSTHGDDPVGGWDSEASNALTGGPKIVWSPSAIGYPPREILEQNLDDYQQHFEHVRNPMFPPKPEKYFQNPFTSYSSKAPLRNPPAKAEKEENTERRSRPSRDDTNQRQGVPEQHLLGWHWNG